MTIHRWALALVVAACLAPDPARAQVAATGLSPLILGWEQFFVISSETVQKRGRTRVEGTVINEAGFAASRVQLLVEGLDASGQVTAQSVVWLGQLLGPGGRGYFDVPAPAGVRHRVSVFAYDWVQAASLDAP
jgi:hypothetical protein